MEESHCASVDQFLTVSKLIPIVRSLQQLTNEARTTIKLGDELSLQMRQRFLNIEANHLLSAATVLDPRFKKITFTDMAVADQSTRHLTQEMAGEIAANDITVEEPNATETASTETQQWLWQLFDQQVADMTSNEHLVQMLLLRCSNT